MEIVKLISATLSIIATVIGISYGTVRFLGKKWIDSKFDKALEAFKHDQSKELEQLKFEINWSLDRTSKLHQHEFEIVPEAWKQLNIAYGAAMDLVKAQEQVPNLNEFGQEALEEFINGLPFKNYKKNELRKSEDKITAYVRFMAEQRMSNAIKNHAEINN
jgi:hypothetical protein